MTTQAWGASVLLSQGSTRPWQVVDHLGR